MGILDDAIRQHLDLKRRLGAEDDELARLEDEAFGPPTRPATPTFPRPAASRLVAETAKDRAQPPRAGCRRAGRAAVGAGGGSLLSSSPSSARQPELGAGPAAETGERSDRRSRADGALLETGEQPDPAEAAAPPRPASTLTAERAAACRDRRACFEPPIESLDTVEHPFEGAIEDTGEAEVVEGELEEPPPPSGEAADEDEDVLEETPEFLRDQPEDDELWFEQGEPKDFDF